MEKLKTKIISLLRQSEKYTKTDMIYLAQGGSWLGLGQVVSMSAVFLTSIAFANLLPPETYGLYKYILSVTSIILITTLSGMDSAVTQAVARDYEGTLNVGVKTKIKWGVLGTSVSLFMAGYYYLQGNTELTLALCIVSLFVPFSESFDMYNSLLWGKKLFSAQTKYNIIRKIITLIILIGTLFVTKNILIIITAYFATLTIPAGFFFWRTVKKHLSNKNIDPEAVSYGKHLSAINIIGLVLGELDKILIFHFLGAVNLAIYSLATAPTDQIKGVMKNVNALAMPQFSNRTPAEIKKTIWHKVRILALASGAIVAGYIIISPFFFRIFFPKYLASIHYSQVLSVSLIPIVIAGFIYTALESQKAKKELYQYNSYTYIIGIVILFPLVYYFGIWGAIISRIISRLFTFAISSWLIRRIV